MRKLLTGGALAAFVLLLAACGGSGSSSKSSAMTERQADMYAISKLERVFHESLSKKDIDEQMSIWAPHATFTFGPGQTATGKAQIRRFWLTKSAAFKPETSWVSDHPAYKLRVTVDGDRGTLHFECHFIDTEDGAGCGRHRGRPGRHQAGRSLARSPTWSGDGPSPEAAPLQRAAY